VAVSLHLSQSGGSRERRRQDDPGNVGTSNEVSVIQTAYNSTNNSTLSKLDDDSQHAADSFADLKKKEEMIEAMQSGTVERKNGLGERRRFKRIFPKERWRRYHEEPRMSFHPQLHSYTPSSSSSPP